MQVVLVFSGSIRGTTTTTLQIIPAPVNGVPPVPEKTAKISRRLKDCWVQANSLHTLFFALCVIDLSLARTVTLAIFIAAEKTFHPSHLQQMHLQQLHIAAHQCYMQRIPEEEDE